MSTNQERHINGHVYLIEGGGFHKIGRAKKPLDRVATLKIQLPFETHLVHTIACEDYVSAERAFHDAYEEDRLRGEWFRLNSDEIAYIRSWTYFAKRHGDRLISRADARSITDFLERRLEERGVGV